MRGSETGKTEIFLSDGVGGGGGIEDQSLTAPLTALILISTGRL